VNLYAGDLGDLDPRNEIDRLLAAVRDAGDKPLGPLFAALARAHPVALAEVACGPRSPGGEALVRAALLHIDVIEATLTPRGAYPRLAELAGEAGTAVLAIAASRHPAASWLLSLSRKVEREQAGATHLFAAAGHPAFAQACRMHAEVGHVEGLVLAAAGTGRPEPAAALLSVHLDPPPRADPHLPLDAALRAAAAALDANPASAVVPHLAAVWGPEPDALFVRLVPSLRRRDAAISLLAHARHLPRTRTVLTAVIRGMR
jgi:hypothetical protein